MFFFSLLDIMAQEVHIQSNFPFIILTIVILCGIVLGYLELKKINIKMDRFLNKIEQSGNIESFKNIENNNNNNNNISSHLQQTSPHLQQTSPHLQQTSPHLQQNVREIYHDKNVKSNNYDDDKKK